MASTSGFGHFRRLAGFRGERACEPHRRDAGAEQRLAGIDIADPGDQPLIEQRRLDRGGFAFEPAREPFGGEGGAQRLDAETLEQRVAVERSWSGSDPYSRSAARPSSGPACRRRDGTRYARASAAALRVADPLMLNRPVMPRCITSTSPSSSRASRYLARRSSASILRPDSLSPNRCGSGKRKSGRRCSTRANALPTRTGSNPRRTVSTSGSSGMCDRLIPQCRRNRSCAATIA